jgi:hypothetical protein
MMRTVLALIAWLATRAGADIRWAGATLGDAAPSAVRLAETTGADRAGQLITVPQDGLEPEVSRSLAAHWALWGAVGLILLILAVGFIRRRWKARGSVRPGHLPSPVSGRGAARK